MRLFCTSIFTYFLVESVVVTVAVGATVGVAVTLFVVAEFVESVPLDGVDVDEPHAVKIADAIKINPNFFILIFLFKLLYSFF